MITAYYYPDYNGVYANLKVWCDKCHVYFGGYELVEDYPVLDPSSLFSLGVAYLKETGWTFKHFGITWCPVCSGKPFHAISQSWLTEARSLDEKASITYHRTLRAGEEESS